MELTQEFFTQEKSLPIITFLGRPRDSKKGLPLFLDALEMLTSLSMIDNFVIWIIGGDDKEVVHVLNTVQLYPLLKSKHEQGSIMIWGRVENSALPELLSRSTALIMPSYREQFGMAAVEAMLCGCPVIGAKVGGLNDLIIPQQTGFLFERGNSVALCNVLSGFLRNKPERKRMRSKAVNWAKHFSQENAFFAITKIYDQCDKDVPDFWKNEYPSEAISQLIELTEKIISRKIDKVEVLRYLGKHLSVKATIENKQYFIKRFNNQASSTNYIFSIDFSRYPDPKSKKEQFAREFFQKDNPFSPQILNYDIENSILITEFLKPSEDSLFKNMQPIIRVINDIRAYRPILRSEAVIDEYYKVIQEFRNCPSLDKMNSIDNISSEINKKITMGFPSFSRIHPQVELYRIKFMIEQKGWYLSFKAEHGFLDVINYLLENVEFNENLPTLAHGDMKQAHFLRSDSNIVICDWEHAKYCIGPLDEAKLTFNIFHKKNEGINVALTFLSELIPDNFFMYQQAIVWFAGQIISDSIYKSTQGDKDSIDNAISYLKDFIFYVESSKYKSINPK